MVQGDPIQRIEAIIEPTLAEMGYELVRVQLFGKQRPTLQVMAERTDRVGMTVDDCAEISRTVSALLDVEDPISGSYTLEVSSPGIDRPLTRPEHFERFKGFEARAETRRPVEGRRRFSGRLGGCSDGVVRIATEAGEAVLPFDEIQRAKLLLTDELIAAAGAPERKE